MIDGVPYRQYWGEVLAGGGETEGEVEPGAQHHGVKAGMAVLTKKFSIGLV